MKTRMTVAPLSSPAKQICFGWHICTKAWKTRPSGRFSRAWWAATLLQTARAATGNNVAFGVNSALGGLCECVCVYIYIYWLHLLQFISVEESKSLWLGVQIMTVDIDLVEDTTLNEVLSYVDVHWNWYFVEIERQ